MKSFIQMLVVVMSFAVATPLQAQDMLKMHSGYKSKGKGSNSNIKRSGKGCVNKNGTSKTKKKKH